MSKVQRPKPPYNKVGRHVPFSEIESQLEYLEGQILTVVDSIVPEGQQNKAAKDVIRAFVTFRMATIWDDCFLKDGKSLI